MKKFFKILFTCPLLIPMLLFTIASTLVSKTKYFFTGSPLGPFHVERLAYRYQGRIERWIDK